MTQISLQPRPQVAPMPEWSSPPQSSWQLANGLSGRHVELPRNGLLKCCVQVIAPLNGEPSGLDGVTDLITRCLAEGRTTMGDPADFAAQLAQLGAEFNTSAAVRGPLLEMAVPASQAWKAIRLLAQVLQHSSFTDSDVTRMIENNTDSYHSSMADPSSRAVHEFYRNAFAASARLSRPDAGSPDTVERVTRGNLDLYWSSIAGPQRTRVLSAGDLSGGEVDRLWADALGTWRPSLQPPVSPESAACCQPTVRLVDRPGSVQTALLIGSATINQHHVDFAALKVAAYVLGVPLGSRLGAVLREQRGYTYGVHAELRPSLSGGAFIISTLVDAAVTVAALQEATTIVNTFRSGGVTAAEHADAVANLLASDLISLQTPDQLAQRLVRQENHDLPPDYQEQYRQSLQRSTPETCNAVFRSHTPETWTVVLVGDAATLEPSLVSAGWQVKGGES